jgi:cell division protein FtsQ
MMDERIADRRASVRRDRRAARLRRTLIVALLCGLAAGLAWFEQSEAAAVRSIEVVGLERIDRQAVLDAAAIPSGRSILRFSTRSIAARVRELPAVRQVVVRRAALDRITIEITERQPVLAVQHWRTVRLLDRDGVVIEDGEMEGLPMVRLATPPPAVGSTFAAHAALSNAYRVWAGLSGPLRVQVVVLDAPDDVGLELELASGVVIRFGRAERIEEKVRAIGAVLDDIAGSEVKVIDVRVPSVPVVTVD